jgi:hypothetical protein
MYVINVDIFNGKRNLTVKAVEVETLSGKLLKKIGESFTYIKVLK